MTRETGSYTRVERSRRGTERAYLREGSLHWTDEEWVAITLEGEVTLRQDYFTDTLIKMWEVLKVRRGTLREGESSEAQLGRRELKPWGVVKEEEVS